MAAPSAKSMSRHVPEGGLTWYRGSIRPYASLWHTLIRLGSLNRLKLSQLPDRTSKNQRTRSPRYTWYPLFNEANEVDTHALAVALGESPAVMRWSHLGNSPPWFRSHFTGHLRFCRTCLTQGYHSSLYSLTLLHACPIHGEPFVDGCPCGAVIGTKLKAVDFARYAGCACGNTIFIDPENCRSPKLPAESTRELDEIAGWLDELTSVVKPRVFKDDHFSCVAPTSIDVGILCDVFDIRHPKNLLKFASHGQPMALTRGGPFCDAPAKPNRVVRQEGNGYWRVGSPSTWTYRAVCRYLRRHGVTDDPRLQRHYSRRHDFSQEVGAFIQDPNFAAAYAEAEWARHLDQNAQERRWPYRDPWADPLKKFTGHLELFGEPNWSNCGPIAQSTKTWIEYHWAAYCMLCVLAYYQDRTERLAAGGSIFQHIEPQKWSWAARVKPDGSALFACLRGRAPLLQVRQRKDKRERIREQEILLQQRAKVAREVCRGPCLTWNPRDSWYVTTALVPDAKDCKLDTLRGSFSERPKFWLFAANGGYVARLKDVALQAPGQSRREAISVLRTAYSQYTKAYCGRPITAMP